MEFIDASSLHCNCISCGFSKLLWFEYHVDIDHTSRAEINLWKLCKNSMFVKIFNVMMTGYPIGEWELPFHWEWLVGNSFKTITSFAYFRRNWLYFSSTSRILLIYGYGTTLLVYYMVHDIFAAYYHRNNILICKATQSGNVHFLTWLPKRLPNSLYTWKTTYSFMTGLF